MMSNKSRAEVKAETKEAAKDGKLKSPGEGSTPPPATPAKTK